MIPYPAVHPVALTIGPINIYWYGIFYCLALMLAYGLARWRVQHYHLHWRLTEIEDLIFYAAMGIFIGGRLGYMLFYNLQGFLESPFSVFAIWQGGMSFHGGFLGVVLACWLFSKKYKRPLLVVTDFAVPLVPTGLALGRLGNFINGELWGRTTTWSIGMIFPQADHLPRHPSQLYEFFLEGIVLFIVIWFYAARPRSVGRVSAVFLIGYAACRMLAECFRQPDSHIGFIAFQGLTMGQLLSLPLFGLGWIIWRKSK